jgi:hypothetical protein
MSTSGNSTPGRYEWIRISETKDRFLRGGKPFFYLADTAWMAFSNLTLEDWEEYLFFRQAQGFNALQIVVMPVTHDTSEDASTMYPFRVGRGGAFDFCAIDERYFEKAVRMVGMARERGFIPVLAPLWVNWIPGTWASAKSPRTAMSFEAAREYLARTLPLFAPYQPIFLASGDTRFESDEVRYYRMVLEQVRMHCPGCLTTLHRSPGADLPEELMRSPDLDFYMYQSGHHIESQDNAYRLAEAFLAKPVKRPIVNGEPCYDGSGYGFRYGRFGRFEVRRASWQSLLSGAKAGLGYGAHGVWSWHRRGACFTSVPFSGQPFDWRTAMRLGGAADASFARTLFERYELFDLEPAGLIRNASPEIRMAMSPDSRKFAIYVPYPVEVEVGMDLSGYALEVVDLDARSFGSAAVEPGVDVSRIAMHGANADVLIVGWKA